MHRLVHNSIAAGLLAGLVAFTGCSASEPIVESACSDGKCDDPNTTANRECEEKCRGDQACFTKCRDEAAVNHCELRKADALELMGQAADKESALEKASISPGPILPARELLGDMLLELGQPAQALREYEASQQREPNRFRGLYGAATAAARSGDVAKASTYFGKLSALAQQGDARPELQQAKQYLASNQAR